MRPTLRLTPFFLSLLSLLVLPAPLAAQGTIRPDRVYVGTSLAVGTSSVGTDPVRLVGLPARASETNCLWIDASGDVASGACPVGTVTSVGLSLPSIFSVSGSPVTSSGTLTATLANQTAYSVFARGSGTGVPSFQALADGHIPDNLTLGTVSGTPTFSGAVTFSDTITPSSTITGSLRPTSTDTYDLGSPSMLWSNGYVSQLNAVVFAEQTASLVGGWLIVPKDQGSTVSAISSGSTSVDFGKAMTVGHFVVIRSVTTAGAYATEYLQVGSLVTGTTYNVTRDLAGAHGTDPAWAAGTAYLVLGTTGDGRIELNAYDTPRISVLTQGATYNAQTETVRIGSLDGISGVPAGKTGIAIVAGSNKILAYDSTLSVAGDGSGITNISGGNIQTGTITATQLAADSVAASEIQAGAVTAAKLEANLVIGTNIQTSATCASSGTCVRLNSSGLQAYSGSTLQFAVDAATGAATAGGGKTVIDATGMTVTMNGSLAWGDDNAVRFSDAANAGESIGLGAYYDPTVGNTQSIVELRNYDGASHQMIRVLAGNNEPLGLGTQTGIIASAGASNTYRYLSLQLDGLGEALNLSSPGGVPTATFTTHLIPSSTNTYNLGSSSYRWNEIWMDRTHETTAAHLPVVGDGGGQLLFKSNGLNALTSCGGGTAVKSINTQYGIVISVTCGAL